MGRRSRKRSSSGAPVDRPAPAAPRPQARPPGAPVRRRAKLAETPQAPWHPFPLVELSILAGLLLVIAAFIARGDAFAPLLLGGLALVALASSELALREHLAGYRSHSSLLALLIAFPAGAAVFSFVTEERAVVLAAFAVVFAAVFATMRSLFIRRSGGLTWRA